LKPEEQVEIPYDIKLLYFSECGFYMHSIYATLYMDTVKKDFAVMLIHHVLTIVLMLMSYSFGFFKIGVCVIFVHDATDILLEYTKCHAYLKNRNGRYYAINELLSNIGFVVFAISWYV
jgi:ceramide synthetase